MSLYMQMMNKNSDREARFTIHAGKKPGTIDALLTARTHFPIHFTFTFDREGAISTGRERYGMGLRHNNFLNFDDTLITGYTFGDHFRGGYVYHSLPISYSGASLLYGVSSSFAKPGKDYAATYDLRTWAESASVSLHQDIYQKDNYLGEVSAGFDAKEKLVRTNDGTLNRDRLRIINVAGNFVKRSMGSTAYFSPQFSQGIDSFLGSDPDENPLASRGAKSLFSKFNISFSTRTLLPLNLQQNVKIKAQFATPKLKPQEQFYLGGIDSVRGYPSGDYVADNVLQTNYELLIPAFFIPRALRLPYSPKSLKDEVTGVLFVDYGLGGKRDEKKYRSLAGVGGGWRISLYDMAFVRLEWGIRIGDPPLTEGTDELRFSKPVRFHISVDVQEKLADELEYIRKIRQEEAIKNSAYKLVDEELVRKGSPIRQKLYGYLYMARKYYKEGNPKRSKVMYEKMGQLAANLYRQAEVYLRSCVSHEAELEVIKESALEYQKTGKLEEAKEAWQNVLSQAKPKALTFEL